jgi:hypothetical protein
MSQPDQGTVAGPVLYDSRLRQRHGPNGLGACLTRLTRRHDPAAGWRRLPYEFNDQAIADVIRSGSVLGKAPIVGCHWGLTDAEIHQLVAYIDC